MLMDIETRHSNKIPQVYLVMHKLNATDYIQVDGVFTSFEKACDYLNEESHEFHKRRNNGSTEVWPADADEEESGFFVHRVFVDNSYGYPVTVEEVWIQRHELNPTEH